MIPVSLSTMEREQSTSWGDKYVFASIFGFVLGVFLSSFIFVSPLVSLLVVLVGISKCVGEKIYGRSLAREVIILALIVISLGFGTLRYSVKDFHEVETPTSTGLVITEPEDKENTRRFVYLSDNGEKVLVSAPLYTAVAYGDRVEVVGKLGVPSVIKGEGGKRDFDYGAYLSKDDIYHTMSFAQVKVLASGQGNALKAYLFRIKHSLVEQAKAILPEPNASLLTGLIVAGRGALPADILEDFRRAGVIHIVVLSGFNITLIAEFLRRIFQSFFIWTKISNLPQVASGASIIGIILFVLMTGAEATVVRAALMAVVVIGAKLWGREYSASRALVFAGFLMLLENPKILVFDPSFQLSFLATLGLIYLMPIVERRLLFVTEKFQLREILSQTLSTQLAVLPLLVYSMGDVSLVSVPANLLILVIVPFTMLMGFVSILLSYISTVLAWPVTYLAHLLLSWIIFVAHTLGGLSFATVSIPNIPAWVVFVIYALIVALVVFAHRVSRDEAGRPAEL